MEQSNSSSVSTVRPTAALATPMLSIRLIQQIVMKTCWHDECVSYSTSSLLLSFYYCLPFSLSDTLSLILLPLHTHIHPFFHHHHEAQMYFHILWVIGHRGWTLADRVFLCVCVCACSALFIVDLHIGHLLKCTASPTHLSWDIHNPYVSVIGAKITVFHADTPWRLLKIMKKEVINCFLHFFHVCSSSVLPKLLVSIHFWEEKRGEMSIFINLSCAVW